MRPTREWIEQLEASGVTWGLFVSITSSAYKNYILTEKDRLRFGTNNVSTMAQATRALWTIRDVKICPDGDVLLTHYEHRVPRSLDKTYVFAREMPKFIKYSCYASKYIRDLQGWKRLGELLKHINPQGIVVPQLLLGEHGLTRHQLTIGFQNENDAVLFNLLSDKTLTNTR